jgi:hypothetical protein
MDYGSHLSRRSKPLNPARRSTGSLRTDGHCWCDETKGSDEDEMGKEYVIYCDESESKGSYFSNFYGGVLVRSSDLIGTVALLEHRKAELNLHREIKWQKVTATYLDKYCALMDAFFDLVKRDKIKVRVMFTQNRYVAQDLEPYHREHEYFLL